MDDPFVAVGLVVFGAILGYASSLALARMQHRQALTLRVADEYFAVRRELVAAVGDLADLELLREVSAAEREAKADAIGTLFYRNFDLLPRPVLDKIILLHVAVRSPFNGPYQLDHSTVVPMPQSQQVSFIERCSIFTNSKFAAPMALSSKNPIIRSNQVVRLHARDVLYTLSEHSSIDQLSKLAQRIQSRYT